MPVFRIASRRRIVPSAGHVPGVLGHVEAHPDMALGAEMVDLVGSDLLEEVGERAGYGQIAVVEIDPRLGVVEVLVEMVDPVGVEGAGPADESVDLVPLAEQELGEVGAVLARDAGDERFFHFNRSFSLFFQCGGDAALLLGAEVGVHREAEDPAAQSSLTGKSPSL